MKAEIIVQDLCVNFPIYTRKSDSIISSMLGLGVEKREFSALDGLNFRLSSGDRVGLIGKNGAGKSTLLKVLAGMLPPSRGRLEIRGKVFPALNPSSGLITGASCIQNIVLQGLRFGLSGAELKEYIKHVAEFSDLGDFLNSPVNTLSAGMKSRFAVSTMSALEPELLFIDEWVGAADAKVLEKNNGLLGDLVENSKIFVIASHRKELLQSFCNKGLVLDGGQVEYFGKIDKALDIAS